MRRLGGPLLVMFGVLFLVVAVGVKFVVAPKGVITPLQIPAKYRTLIAAGSNFTLLDAQTGASKLVTVRVTRHLEGDVGAGDSKVAVYDESLCLSDNTDGTNPGCLKASDPRLITNTTDRVAFDRKSGEAVNDAKYHANVDGDTSIQHHGMGYKFPIDSKKKAYQFFDTVVGKAFPMNYSGTEKIHGLTVYKFVQMITNQPVLTNHVLPSTYTNTRTVWVEPTTGVIIKGSEDLTQTLTGRASLDPNSELRDPALQGKVALKGLLVFDDATVANQAQLAKDSLAKIHLVRMWIPLVSLVLGVILTALGIALSVRRSEPGAHAEDRVRPRVPEPVG
jgi:Porin PorA